LRGITRSAATFLRESVKLLTRYIVREHIGPIVFALSSLTALLLLQQVAKQFGNLVGKGLSWGIIGEFFLLSIPFIIAMTMPMGVLVAVLYAFSRLTSENEVTALRASGISVMRLVRPALVGGALLGLVMLVFNDQILPRSNHRLRTLQTDIARKKPTFALREQVINEVMQGKLFLRTSHIDEATNRMRGVTIYNFDDPERRKTIYADSGFMEMTPDQKDLQMKLHDGYLQQIPRDNLAELTRLYFRSNLVRVRGVGNRFEQTEKDDYKSEREMSVCEMAKGLAQGNDDLESAQATLASTLVAATHYLATGEQLPLKAAPKPRERLTAGSLYCKLATPIFGNAAIADSDSAAAPAPGLPKVLPLPKPAAVAAAGSTTTSVAAAPAAAPAAGGAPPPSSRTPMQTRAAHGVPMRAPPSSGAVARAPSSGPASTRAPMSASEAMARASLRGGGRTFEPPQVPSQLTSPAYLLSSGAQIEVMKARVRDAQTTMSRYETEIQKKFALAAACVVFVLLGAPLGIRFPRGGVGLVIGVSIVVFALYYVGLIVGEDLADKLILNPIVAMWMANALFTVVGVVGLFRVQRHGGSARGGDLSEAFDAARAWLARVGRRVGLSWDRRRRVTA
jgi:lipopolysaccharide export system permease protein